MASAITFTWPVVESGYRWEDKNTASGPQRVLEADLPDGRYLTRPYEPLLDRPGLFRDFAETETTESGIVGFANQYGPLGVRSGRQGFDLHLAEPFHVWVRQIQEMKRAVDLYDSLRSNVRRLDGLIRWESDEQGEASVYYTGTPGDKELIASSRLSVEVFETFPRGDKIIPARWFLQGLVNRNMALLVELRLRHYASWEPCLLGVPRNLLGTLWFQFAEVYAGKELRRCLECKEWFAVRGRGPRKRSDVQFCSVACRNRAYRGRQERARRLHAGGKMAKQIAAELGSDAKTVKGWIGGKRKEK